MEKKTPNNPTRLWFAAPASKVDVLKIGASENPADYEFKDEWPSAQRPWLHARSVEGDRELFTSPPRVLPAWMSRISPLRVVPAWIFHKNDVDPWPSVLHAHHTEQPLKLDAITGDIFQIHTRKRVQKLKTKELARIQAVLLASKDFSERARTLFGPTS